MNHVILILERSLDEQNLAPRQPSSAASISGVDSLFTYETGRAQFDPCRPSHIVDRLELSGLLKTVHEPSPHNEAVQASVSDNRCSPLRGARGCGRVPFATQNEIQPPGERCRTARNRTEAEHQTTPDEEAAGHLLPAAFAIEPACLKLNTVC
jgi:hypothetical protein